MSIHRFSLKLISPAFLAGADKSSPEMRASSIRGQLRYWLRAIIGAKTTDLTVLRDRESAVFGSTSVGSTVSVRAYRDKETKFKKYSMLPHKSNEREQSPQQALNEGQIWDLEMVTRPGVPLPDDALNALMAWSLLGGIGRRSRRMFGAVEIKPRPDEQIDWYQTPESPDDFINNVRTLMTQIVNYPPHATIPNFPTLNQNHAWIVVGKTLYGDYEDMVKELFRGLLRIDAFRAKEDTFGGIRPRRSSPLIAQVRRVGKDGYFPVLTALKSQPDKTIDWTHLKKFMHAAESYFNGVTVWGGW